MNWRIIFRSLKNKDMQKRLAIVVGIIVVYRMLAHIPVPLANPTQMKTIATVLSPWAKFMAAEVIASSPATSRRILRFRADNILTPSC